MGPSNQDNGHQKEQAPKRAKPVTKRRQTGSQAGPTAQQGVDQR